MKHKYKREDVKVGIESKRGICRLKRWMAKWRRKLRTTQKASSQGEQSGRHGMAEMKAGGQKGSLKMDGKHEGKWVKINGRQA